MYLAGPFKGAPLSLVAITPALAGPYDYGTVVVRVALHVDPLDAHVIADSETVPQIIGGIPIRMRSIQVNIDKPNFMINPTNCGPFSVALRRDRRPGHGGRLLLLLPRRQLRRARVQAEDDDHASSAAASRPGGPRTRACGSTCDREPGDANIKSVAVTLPKAFEIDQRHLGNICSEAAAGKGTLCRAASRSAPSTTETPLLEAAAQRPGLRGLGFGGLPHVVFILDGQVTLTARGADRRRCNGGHLKTTVPVVPDAPIGHFRLNLFGGKQRLPDQHPQSLQRTRRLRSRIRRTEREATVPMLDIFPVDLQ